MKPPLSYYGGKTAIAPWIVEHLPAHEHYVEPYAGSLAVLLAKAPSPMETVNDIDEYLVTFWRVLRDRGADLQHAVDLTPHSRAEYRDTALESDLDEVEMARRVWVLLTQGRGRATRSEKKQGWRCYQNPRGSNSSMPDYLDAYRTRIGPAVQRLRSVSLECLPALDVIGKYGAHPGVLLYVDPPYPGQARDHRAQYRHEMRTDAEHADLAEALHAARAAVVLSGYHCPLYDELYAGWDRVSLDTQTGNGNGDRSRVEVLWSNRPLGRTGQLDLLAGMDQDPTSGPP